MTGIKILILLSICLYEINTQEPPNTTEKNQGTTSNVSENAGSKIIKGSVRQGNVAGKKNDAKKKSTSSSNDVIVLNEENVNETSKCPVFNTRYEKDDLIVEIEPDNCEIVASIKATRMPLMKSNRRQQSRNKKNKKNNIKFRPYYHPVVSYRTVNRTTETNNTTTIETNNNNNNNNNVTTCEEHQIKPLGPYVVVESVPGLCQFVIGVVREKKNFLSRLRGNRRQTQLAIEYIDELLL